MLGDRPGVARAGAPRQPVARPPPSGFVHNPSRRNRRYQFAFSANPDILGRHRMISTKLKEIAPMNRRTFLRAAASLSAVAATSRLAGLAAPAHAQQKEFAPRPGAWRRFKIITRVEILSTAGVNSA